MSKQNPYSFRDPIRAEIAPSQIVERDQNLLVSRVTVLALQFIGTNTMFFHRSFGMDVGCASLIVILLALTCPVFWGTRWNRLVGLLIGVLNMFASLFVGAIIHLYLFRLDGVQ